MAEPDTNSLITVARAKAAPQLAAVSDSVLGTLILSASAAIERYCNRRFISQSHTETFDGDGDCERLLSRFPLVSLTSVTITEDDGTAVSITADQFRYNPATGLIRFKPDSTAQYTYFPRGFQNIQVVYVAGFATVPANVQQACVLLVAWLHASETRDQAKRSESLGDYAVSWAEQATEADLPNNVKLLLTTYRDIRA